jgi:tetratricopeptide (TPR) repeat protein
MNRRVALIGSVIVIALTAATGGVGWTPWHALPAKAQANGKGPQDNASAEQVLPIPPLPPRIATGEDYDRCLGMLSIDPAGANVFADAWEATGGGDGATHCRALAEIALGAPGTGAELMDKLAGASQAPAGARASVYGQAGQAWLMAGDPGRAFGSATLALSLTSDDADLLIDRSIAAATLERYDDAVDDLSHALDLDPRRVDALVFRGAAWRHLNHLELAQDDIDRAFAQDPENPEALLERGILRQRRGDRDGARQDWEQAIALSPDTATGDLAQQNLALLEAGPDRR